MRQSTRVHRLGERLSAERGIALVLAVGILAVLAIAVTSATYFTSTNSRSANLSEADQVARSLAEAGLNNALAVVFDPNNNAADPSILPSDEASASSGPYAGGTAKWWGVLSGQTWTLHGLGIVANPTGASDRRHEITSTVDVSFSLTGPLNNHVWNYLNATRTGNSCDQTLENSITIDAPLFVEGNLCLQNSASVTKGPLVVRGTLTMESASNAVGLSDEPITEAHVVGGCMVTGFTGSYRTPCAYGGAPDGDNVWASSIDASPTSDTVPSADFGTWYSDADTLNSASDCNVVSGTPPTFDNDSTRNSSVTTVQDLTPGDSYTCRKTSGAATVAELSWDAASNTLTVAGTVFIDGSATVANGEKNAYDGQATLYLSGTLLVGSSTHLCAVDSGGNCDWAGWNPNSELLVVVADHSGGQVNAGNGIQVDNSGTWQGGLFATNAVELGNSVLAQGPIIASHLRLANSVTAYSFPLLATVPRATPGQPNVFAQPQPPRNFRA